MLTRAVVCEPEAKLPKAKLPVVPAAAVAPIMNFQSSVGYKDANKTFLVSQEYPLQLGFADTVTAVSSERILKTTVFQDCNQPECINSRFTMPKQAATYWIEELGRLAWAIKVAPGRAGVRAEHYNFYSLNLTQLQTGAEEFILRPVGNWAPAPCSMGIFDGWKALTVISTVFEGNVVYLAGQFQHNQQPGRPVKMMQCSSVPQFFIDLLDEAQQPPQVANNKGQGKGR